MFGLKLAICIVLGYGLGNFSTGILVGKYIGKTDIRQYGSGSSGATNVLRTLGWIPSVLTLIGDALKGVIPALVGYWLLGEIGARIGGLCAVIGHIWPVAYKFRGGKGIATSAGVLAVTDPLILLGLVVLQLIIIAATRYMSLASLTSAVLYFPLILIFHREPVAIVCAAVLSGLLIYAHRSNIGRLLNKGENRLDFSQFKLKNTPKS